MRIYGPYTRRDGRKHIVYVYADGRKRTQSYPRYIMEQHLGRELLDNETVDHINEDFTDDRLENLQLLTRAENIVKSTKPAAIFSFNCPICGVASTKPLRDVLANRNKGKSGPYCSRKCAGLVGK